MLTLLIGGRTLLLSIKPIAGPTALHRDAFHRELRERVLVDVCKRYNCCACIKDVLHLFPLSRSFLLEY